LGLVLGCCHAGHRAHLGVAHLSALKRTVDQRQARQGTGNAHLLARGAGVESDAPAQPVSAADSALIEPAFRFIELSNAGEQAMSGRIDVRSGLRDFVGELLNIHGRRGY
jgi:hypothetical protein